MPDLLIEIGCEEIPARMIDAAREEFAKRVSDLLQRERLLSHSGNHSLTAFSTPRRLAVLARNVESRQTDVREQLVGPATKVAYKDGNPTAAAEAFARKAGIDVAKLEKITNPKGEYIAANVTRAGRTAAEVLSEALPKELNALYWAKNMYWRANKPERFVRPVRWIVSLLDDRILPLEYAGVHAGDRSRGHRILAASEVRISSPSAYTSELKSNKVVVDPAERLHQIRKALDAATRTIAGARWREDSELLNTVVNLTEYPGVILGSFDRAFLSLPEEVLVTVMRDHQKYFAVEDASGKLAPHFLAVLNTDADHDGIIRHGNERVLRARFNDAQFFWHTDQKVSLTERVEMLRSVTFQKELGSYFDKTERVRRSATNIAARLREVNISADHNVVHEAARLSKADLTTELVKEFTELQGIVGGLYVRVQGVHGHDVSFVQAVSRAIYDHYKPESMSDGIPRTIEGCAVSIADKADTIAGMFLLGQQPSGSKDPFALRRQANGILRILAEQNLSIPISEIMVKAIDPYMQIVNSRIAIMESPSEYARTWCLGFFRERLEFYMKEHLGIPYDVCNAVLATSGDGVAFDDVPDAIARAKALIKVRDYPDFQSIALSFKRIKNILRQASERNVRVAPHFEYLPNAEHEEKNLDAYATSVLAHLRRGSEKDYVDSLLQIATIRERLDTFFDKVMVMVDDEKLRANRLALLATMQRSFSTLADFSEIVTENPGKR